MRAPNWWVRRSKNRIDRLWQLMDSIVWRLERLEDNAPIQVTGNTEEAQRAIASLVSQLDDANAEIRRLTAQENAA